MGAMGPKKNTAGERRDGALCFCLVKFDAAVIYGGCHVSADAFLVVPAKMVYAGRSFFIAGLLQ